MSSKRELDLRLSCELDLPLSDVSKLTTVFLAAVRDLLVERGRLRLDGIGTLTVGVGRLSGGINLVKGTFKKGETAGTIKVSTRKQIRVSFSKAPTLSRMLRRQYGGSHE